LHLLRDIFLGHLPRILQKRVAPFYFVCLDGSPCGFIACP